MIPTPNASLRGVTVETTVRVLAVNEVSFDVRRGEILGVAGLVGSGRTETVRAMMGLDPVESGALDYLVAFDLASFELGFALGTGVRYQM